MSEGFRAGFVAVLALALAGGAVADESKGDAAQSKGEQIERLKQEAAAMRDRLQSLDDQIAVMTKEMQYEQVRQSAEKVFHGDMPTIVATAMVNGQWAAILKSGEGGQSFYRVGDTVGNAKIVHVDDRSVIVQQGGRRIPLKREVRTDMASGGKTQGASSGAPVGGAGVIPLPEALMRAVPSPMPMTLPAKPR